MDDHAALGDAEDLEQEPATGEAPSDTAPVAEAPPARKQKVITDSRLLGIETALGPEALRLKTMRGEEALSRLFRFDLELTASDPGIDYKAVVGKGATVRLKLSDSTPRYFNGIISRIVQAPTEGGSAMFRAELVPWTWLLTRTTNCRIFQNLTAPAIVEKVFRDHGFQDFRSHLQQQYPVREYCAQYRETDFNFISRLLEDCGIWYFFEHENGKHTLVLCDVAAEHKPCPKQPKARLTRSQDDRQRLIDVINTWAMGHELRPSGYALQAFNFETPSTNLGVKVESVHASPTGAKPEVYDYPGGYAKRTEGEALVRTRIEEEEAQALIIRGTSTCRAFAAGYRFDLTEHPRKEVNQAYALVSVSHQTYEPQGMGPQAEDEERPPPYVNAFSCLPIAVPFRPKRVTPRPVIHGAQTAIVCGKKGEEVWVDKHGRVKVQFHWDREGKRDENSSCWIRVAQHWAGKRWGTLFLPRVGQEVLVEFLEGDPDQPIVTGRVYNAEQGPPYDLPADQTKSGIKSSSSKGGGGFNELRFDDKKGAEQVFIHGQRDLDLVIKRDAREHIGNELHVIVDKSRLEHVKAESHLKVDGNRVEDVGKDLVLKAGRLIIESVGTITLKSAAGFVQIDGSGVTIQGALVNINSGGTPATTAAQLRLPQQASTSAPGEASSEPGTEDTEKAKHQLVVAYYQEQLAKHRAKMSPEEKKAADEALKELQAAADRGDADGVLRSSQKLHKMLEKAAGQPIDPPPGFVAAGKDADGHTILAPATPASQAAAPAAAAAGTAQLRGKLVADGRIFRDAAGRIFRPVFASTLTGLAPGKNALAMLDWVRSAGFNGVRVFAGALTWAGQTADGARAALPGFLNAAAERGLYVEVTCLTDTGKAPFDKSRHLQEIAAIVKTMPHVLIEIANEFFHDTQDRDVHDPGWLRQQIGIFREGGHPVAIGAPHEDEPSEGRWDGTGGNYGTAHLDRGRDKWNQVRRVREIEACSDAGKFPVLNNEPIGAAEPGTPGQRRNDPEFFFTLGALNRLFEVGGVFHFQDGLHCNVPVGGVQQKCAEAFVRGSHAMDSIDARLTFKNATWADSPVGGANFDGTIVRAYSGVSGNDGFTVLVGLSGDPGLRWANGWGPVKVVDEMPGVQILAIKRA
jgi:type VI secretion system secreted protein VgrG